MTETLEEILKINNLDVVGVGHDGKQAIELCQKYKPDYLILDLSMPEFDGFRALEKIKDTAKIIVLTGIIVQDTLAKLNQFLIFSIITKPVEAEELLKIFDIL